MLKDYVILEDMLPLFNKQYWWKNDIENGISFTIGFDNSDSVRSSIQNMFIGIGESVESQEAAEGYLRQVICELCMQYDPKDLKIALMDWKNDAFKLFGYTDKHPFIMPHVTMIQGKSNEFSEDYRDTFETIVEIIKAREEDPCSVYNRQVFVLHNISFGCDMSERDDIMKENFKYMYEHGPSVGVHIIVSTTECIWNCMTKHIDNDNAVKVIIGNDAKVHIGDDQYKYDIGLLTDNILKAYVGDMYIYAKLQKNRKF